MVDKAGTPSPSMRTITLKKRPRFVSRGGEKLAHALRMFGLDVAGLGAIDIGASTGGFVDCLLQAGASRVIALDVGRGQLDLRLRNDPGSSSSRRSTRATSSPTISLSFLSSSPWTSPSSRSARCCPLSCRCMDAVCRGWCSSSPVRGRSQTGGKGGIVRDPAVHREVLVFPGAFVVDELGLELLGLTDSGLPGADGNVEYFFYIGRGGEKGHGT